MRDSREEKLPRWAQEALEQARLRASLCWPTVPRPEPIVVPSSGLSERECPAGEYWRVIGHHGEYRAERRWKIGPHFYTSRDGQSGTGSRGEGIYYPTESDARAAVWWKIAEHAARNLYQAQLLYGIAQE